MSSISVWSSQAAVPLLSLMTFLPLTAALAVWRCHAQWRWRLALTVAVLNVALSGYLLWLFDPGKPGIHLAEQLNLLGLNYRVGVDGSSILFIPLSAILGSLVLVYTLLTRNRTNPVFIASVLAYQGILIGAFSALNTLQFWFWCLLELIPLVLMTRCSGTGRHRHWVMRSVLRYWLFGLSMSLIGFLLLAFDSGGFVFDWLQLQQRQQAIAHESLIFVLLLFGFAVRMPLFPFHAWLPLLAEHGSPASTAVFLCGLKLGVYAMVRFILPLLPDAAQTWAHFVVALGLIGIFYGALLALMQINMRRLLAFAVISHTGMLVIGVFSFNDFALEGSLLLAVAYGLASAGMLFSIGLIYERSRTAYLPRLGGLFDSNTPIALLFLICALSTMVMPGTPGFDPAHLLIEGAIEEHGWLMAIGILFGNVLAAGFLLWAFQRLFIAHAKRRIQPDAVTRHPVLKERIIAWTIGGLLVITGFYTTPWLNYIARDASAIERHYPHHPYAR